MNVDTLKNLSQEDKDKLEQVVQDTIRKGRQGEYITRKETFEAMSAVKALSEEDKLKIWGFIVGACDHPPRPFGDHPPPPPPPRPFGVPRPAVDPNVPPRPAVDPNASPKMCAMCRKVNEAKTRLGKLIYTAKFVHDLYDEMKEIKKLLKDFR